MKQRIKILKNRYPQPWEIWYILFSNCFAYQKCKSEHHSCWTLFSFIRLEFPSPWSSHLSAAHFLIFFADITQRSGFLTPSVRLWIAIHIFSLDLLLCPSVANGLLNLLPENPWVFLKSWFCLLNPPHSSPLCSKK